MKSVKSTSYPWRLIVLLGSNILLAFTIMYSFSTYLPQLIHRLGYQWKEVGYQVGIINGIFFIAGGLGTLTLGLISATCSQKYCLVVTSALQGVSMVLLGFSNNLNMIYIVMFFIGSFSSGINCMKAILNKICNENNQGNIISWAFSGPLVVSLSLGPTLAGVFAFPADNYGNIFPKHSLFDVYPTLFVNLMYGLLLVGLSITTWLILPADKNIQGVVQSSIKYTSIDNDLDKSNEKEDLEPFKEEKQDSLLDAARGLKHKSYIPANITFGLFAMCQVGYTVALPLWLETPIELKGRNFDTKDVSMVWLVSGLAFTAINYLLLGRINQLLKPKTSFAFWLLILIISVACIPALGGITNKRLFFAACVTLHTIILSAIAGGYTSVLLFNQNSVPARSVPLALSITQVVTRILEAIGAFLIGAVYAWSLKFHEGTHGHGKHATSFINSHFVFLCMSVAYILVYIPVIFIRKDIDQKQLD